MFSHVCIGSVNVEDAARFYDAWFKVLGGSRFFDAGGVVGWRTEAGGAALYVGPPFEGAAHPGNGWMAAFRAPSRAVVDAAHAAALAHGGVCAGPPGLRPHYAPDYYGAYVRDPDGNKLHVVHRTEWGVLPAP